MFIVYKFSDRCFIMNKSDQDRVVKKITQDWGYSLDDADIEVIDEDNVMIKLDINIQIV